MTSESQDPEGLILLGATGQIGRLTLEVVARYPERLRVLGLAAGHNGAALAEQAVRFAPAAVALADDRAAEEFAAQAGERWQGEILVGDDASARLARWPNAPVVINGIVGAAGLAPTLAALESGRRLGLANKESLVAAGELVCRTRDRHGSSIVPIDSEHSALFQCLAGRSPAEIADLILTASGGPFRERTPAQMAEATPAEALQHPTWRMGARITVDAATLFNKGMELIEAHWLFDLPWSRLHALIHPQSIVHGLVRLKDGALIAHLSQPDMRLPIQYALSYPERWEAPASDSAVCDLAQIGSLTFAEPDMGRFPCLGIARKAGERGGTAPTVCNAADEVLVAAFLEERITLPDIARGLEWSLARHRVVAEPTLEQILTADQWARQEIEVFLHDGHAAR